MALNSSCYHLVGTYDSTKCFQVINLQCNAKGLRAIFEDENPCSLQLSKRSEMNILH